MGLFLKDDPEAEAKKATAKEAAKAAKAKKAIVGPTPQPIPVTSQCLI